MKNVIELLLPTSFCGTLKFMPISNCNSASWASKIGDRYDWTTGALRDGNEWKSTVSYLVRTPRVPFLMLTLIGLEAKNLLAFQGRCGIASIVRWNLRPVIFGADKRKSGRGETPMNQKHQLTQA